MSQVLNKNPYVTNWEWDQAHHLPQGMFNGTTAKDTSQASMFCFGGFFGGVGVSVVFVFFTVFDDLKVRLGCPTIFRGVPPPLFSPLAYKLQ